MSSIGVPMPILSIICAFAITTTEVGSEFPTERDATSTLTEVKCVGIVVHRKTSSKCQGTFLTQKHMATSCRCTGHTDPKTGVYTKASPDEYEVQSWSKGPRETQAVAKLYYYHNCGIEPNKVLMDLGLVVTKGAFSEAAVVPADLPQAHIFRFYEYIYRLELLETRCMTTSLDSPPGTLLNVTVKFPVLCPFKNLCINSQRKNCQLIFLGTNHVCAIPKVDAPPQPKSTTPRPASTTEPPKIKECTATAGAPLLCHKLLVGINGRSANCDDPYNSFMYIRMDYTMYWIMSTICTENNS